MRRAYGYNVVTMPVGPKVESDTFQCAHCNATVFIDAKEPSPWCSCCDAQWCGQTKCRQCTPFMRKVERAESEALNRTRLWREADNC